MVRDIAINGRRSQKTLVKEEEPFASLSAGPNKHNTFPLVKKSTLDHEHTEDVLDIVLSSMERHPHCPETISRWLFPLQISAHMSR